MDEVESSMTQLMFMNDVIYRHISRSCKSKCSSMKCLGEDSIHSLLHHIDMLSIARMLLSRI